jgi:hypothetical protein
MILDGSALGNFTKGNNVVFVPLTPNVGNAGTYVRFHEGDETVAYLPMI